MKVRVIDGNGTAAVINENLEIESEERVSGELRRFLDRTKGSREGTVTLDALEPEFLIDLYVRTPVRRVEPQSPEGSPERVRWERQSARYGPPTSDIGERPEGGGVNRGDDFGLGSATRSPSAGGAGE